MRHLSILVANLAFALVTATSALAVPSILNSGFEANANGGAGYGSINNWTAVGGTGTNTVAQPFASGTAIPEGTQVAFIQNVGSLSQNVSGFDPGKEYTLSLRYNSRNCCGDFPHMTVNIGGASVEIFNVVHTASPNPYYTLTIPFTATAATQTISVTSANTGGPDASLLVDDFSIAEASFVTLNNPSFEANTNPWPGNGPISGWTGGTGVNPATGIPACCGTQPFGPGDGGPNAPAPDATNFAYIQGNGDLSQMVNGLIPGRQYTLLYYDGHRNGDSGTGDTLEALMGGISLGIFTPSANQWNQRQLNFVANASSMLLTFRHGNVVADQSVSIDGVAIVTARIIPEPASAALGLMGLVSLAMRRRVRQA